MKFVSSLFLAICILPPAPVAADVTVGTVVLVNEGHQTDLKKVLRRRTPGDPTCSDESHPVDVEAPRARRS